MCRRTGCACAFVFLIALFIPLAFVDMAETPAWTCTGSSNYIENSTFGHNRQQALASLVANVSITGYYNVTVGKTPDQVIAAAQCRGDLDGEACQACVSDVASQVARRCPKNKAAAFVLASCIMYVADTKLTVAETFVNISILSIETIPNPQRFKPILTFFLKKVIDSATTNPSGRLYWGDSFKYTQNLTIFGMAQCLQYLSAKRCKSCLDGAFTVVLKDAANRVGAMVYHNAECTINFNIFPTFTPPPHKIAPSNASTNCSPPLSSNKVGSPFHRNLKALLSYLIVHTPFPGYYTDTVNLDSSQVYGEAFCRGDVTRDVCWYCIAQASIKVQELCPKSRRAIIWLDHCQLRYSDKNFTGTLDVYNRACQSAAENVSSNPTSFNQNLRILIANLTAQAMHNFPIRFFATGMSLLPDSSQRIYALAQCVRDISKDQCRWCLQNASSDIQKCSNGKQGGRILRGSCNLAFGVQPFFLGDPTVTLVSLPQPNHGNQHRWMFLPICLIGGFMLTAAFASCLVQIQKQHLEKLKQRETTSINFESAEEDETTFDLRQISLRTIRYATDNFSESNKLGEGGYGPVYKGKLPNGQEIAVKRLSGHSRQGLRQFRNEVESMAKLQHTNLVKLVGCCLEKGEKMLIYEYMPNKSLDFFLKGPESGALLDWEKRFNIILGIAKGMLYLHQDSRLNIIHRDLKASNVLLDEQLHPKISDFGLARIFNELHGQGTTNVIVGTYGYMAPEYAMGGVLSTKSDVFSFGILLLEIINGRLNNASTYTSHGQSCGLVEHAWSLWCEEKGTEFADPILKDVTTSARDQMQRCLHIGLLCVEEDVATRPTMSTVVLMLGNNSVDLPLPTKPAFIWETDAESSLPRSSTMWVANKSTTR